MHSICPPNNHSAIFFLKKQIVTTPYIYLDIRIQLNKLEQYYVM